MSDTQVTPNLRVRLLVALGMGAFGAVLALAAFDIGPLSTADINGPGWLGIASGGVFIAGGLGFLAGQQRPVLSGVFAILALIGLAALGNWVAFGFGARTCGASIVFWAGELQGLGCRIPFGIGAVMTNAIVIVFGVVTLQTALGGPPRLARTRRAAEVLVLISLLPVLVPIFLIMAVAMFFKALKTRLTSGQWPRNEEFIARQKERARARANKKP